MTFSFFPSIGTDKAACTIFYGVDEKKHKSVFIEADLAWAAKPRTRTIGTPSFLEQEE